MSPFAVLLIGSVLVLSGWLQFRQFDLLNRGKSEAITLIISIPLILGLIVFLGTAVFQVFDYNNRVDPTQKDLEIALTTSVSALVFAIVLLVKSVFGPVVGGLLLSYSIYWAFKEGEFRLWPFMDWAVSLLLHSGSDTAVYVYAAVYFLAVSIVQFCLGGLDSV